MLDNVLREVILSVVKDLVPSLSRDVKNAEARFLSLDKFQDRNDEMLLNSLRGVSVLKQ